MKNPSEAKKFSRMYLLNLKMEKITALVGKNGTGKSTLVSLIANFVKLDGGRIEKGRISAMPDSDNLFYDMTGLDFLKYMQGVKGMKKDFLLILNLATQFSLDKDLKKKIFSFIQTYMGEYDSYIFDESTSDVNVENSTVMMDLIRKLRDKNESIFLTSHNLDEISEVSDFVYVLDKRTITSYGQFNKYLTVNSQVSMLPPSRIPLCGTKLVSYYLS